MLGTLIFLASKICDSQLVSEPPGLASDELSNKIFTLVEVFMNENTESMEEKITNCYNNTVYFPIILKY